MIEPSLKCPASGPPADWLRRHGLTPSDTCGACRFLREKGARMSKVHSKFCCARCESWLQSESTKASAPMSKSSTYPEDQGSAGDGSAPPGELPSSDNQQKSLIHLQMMLTMNHFNENYLHKTPSAGRRPGRTERG